MNNEREVGTVHIKYPMRAAGIGPASQPWQGRVLPLNHARKKNGIFEKYIPPS